MITVSDTYRAESKTVATFLVYLGKKTGIPIEGHVKEIANGVICREDELEVLTNFLLEILDKLNQRQLELVVYSKNSTAKKLAEWWEEKETDKLAAAAQQFRKTGWKDSNICKDCGLEIRTWGDGPGSGKGNYCESHFLGHCSEDVAQNSIINATERNKND
jgi:hypothetical protein